MDFIWIPDNVPMYPFLRNKPRIKSYYQESTLPKFQIMFPDNIVRNPLRCGLTNISYQ